MTNDLISFGVGWYGGKILFYGTLFLLAIIVAYPWLLLIAFGFWWLAREPKTEAAGVAAASPAAPPADAGARRPNPSPELPS